MERQSCSLAGVLASVIEQDLHAKRLHVVTEITNYSCPVSRWTLDSHPHLLLISKLTCLDCIYSRNLAQMLALKTRQGYL